MLAIVYHRNKIRDGNILFDEYRVSLAMLIWLFDNFLYVHYDNKVAKLSGALNKNHCLD